MVAEDTVDEGVGIEELLHVFGTRDDNGTRAEGRDRNFLALTDRVAAAVAFAGCRTNTDAWRGCWASRLIPEELRVDALVDRGFIRTPETVLFDEYLVEAVAANGLADVIVGIHHADVEFGDAGLGGFIAGPDSSLFVAGDELGQGRTGHGLTADSRHLEAAVLEDLDVGLLEVRVVESQTEHQGGLVEEALLGLCRCVEDVLHADAFLAIAELDLEHAFADPPVGNESAVVEEDLEIWDCTEMSSDCHGTDTERSRGWSGW